MKFEDGITYLKTIDQFTIDVGCSVVLGLCAMMIMALLFLFLKKHVFKNDNYVPLVISFVASIIVTITLSYVSHPYLFDNSTTYEVTIDDSVSYNEVIQNYEIISIDENTTILKEK